VVQATHCKNDNQANDNTYFEGYKATIGSRRKAFSGEVPIQIIVNSVQDTAITEDIITKLISQAKGSMDEDCIQHKHGNAFEDVPLTTM
jgi:hypothetical protein